MSICTFAACAVGVTIRPTTPVGAMTAMFAVDAGVRAPVDGELRNSRLAPAPITPAGIVSTLHLLLEAEQPLELPGPLCPRALLLKLHLQLAELPLEPLVLGAHAAQTDVAVPARRERRRSGPPPRAAPRRTRRT